MRSHPENGEAPTAGTRRGLDSKTLLSQGDECSESSAAALRFQAFVLREVEPTPDFTCSRREPAGLTATEKAAWAVVFENLRRDPNLIGGYVEEIH